MADQLLEVTDVPLLVSEILVGEGMADHNVSSDPENAVRHLFKRRRLNGKQPVPGSLLDSPPEEPATWKDVFQMVNADVPPKGRVYYDEGSEVIGKIQALVPQFLVGHVVFCRGTVRVQGARDKGDLDRIPLMKTIVVRRDTGEIAEDGPVEQWTKIPKYHRGRKGIPARFSVTVHGAPREVERVARVPEVASGSNPLAVLDPESRPMPREQNVSQPEPAVASSLAPAAISDEPFQMEEAEPRDVPKGLEIGFPPKSIPRHGPGYFALNAEERRELARLHNNLGHPEATLFAKFLSERKAEPKFVRAAGDYSCSACLEAVPKPKNARPSAIHMDGDFGDVLGLDIAYWKNGRGQTFMFTHVICESTLFHMAVGAGRSPEEQFSALSDRWFSFAGVPQVIYVDPAGEYTCEFWRTQLQKENIKSKVSAAESHWQLGRVESHGRILKDMLSRMDAEQEIGDEQEFRLSLRQAVWAKNSLSRVKGYTPEQAVFGKMSRLPGSIIDL